MMDKVNGHCHLQLSNCLSLYNCKGQKTQLIQPTHSKNEEDEG